MSEQPLRLDHLMWGASSLEQGIEIAEDLFKVQAAPGGSHAGLGTCNALLSLGESVYLEIIAPDPEQQVHSTFVSNLTALSEPALVTFAVGSNALPAAAQRARLAGLDVSGPQATQRRTPAGDLLAWELLYFIGHDHGGLMPFVIDWLNTPSPALSAPPAGRFMSMQVHSPHAEQLAAQYSQLQIDVEVVFAEHAAITATIDSVGGSVTLSSSQQSLALRG
jgi:hypothetical protein